MVSDDVRIVIGILVSATGLFVLVNGAYAVVTDLADGLPLVVIMVMGIVLLVGGGGVIRSDW